MGARQVFFAKTMDGNEVEKRKRRQRMGDLRRFTFADVFRRTRAHRSSQHCLIALIVLPVLLLITWSIIRTLPPSWLFSHPTTTRCQNLPFATQIPDTSAVIDNQYHAFPPLPLDNTSLSTYRRPDTLDTFSTYTYRQHPHCNISSLSLHTPFSPLCPSRPSFLEAFSSGGRIGFDAPYMPRHCDMRWYTTPELCSIFSRFSKVIVVGDSMMRHVVGALNVLLREDLGYGAVTGWNFGATEEEECFCTHQMDVKSCSVQGVYRTSDVLRHDADSFACAKRSVKTKDESGRTVTRWESDVNLVVELMLKFPLDPTEVKRFQGLLPREKPDRPIAFVFGHGLWNDLDLQATVNWLDGILEAVYEVAPYLRVENLPVEEGTGLPFAHMLFMTPNAAGILKPDQWVLSQGDKALQVFEGAMHSLIHREGKRFYGKGIEHMGTWNMSVQMDKWDGVHLNLRGNLLKAMGVVNWLGGIEVERW